MLYMLISVTVCPCPCFRSLIQSSFKLQMAQWMTKPEQIWYIRIISTIYVQTDIWNSIRCWCLWFLSGTSQNLTISMSFVAIKFGYFRLLVSLPCTRKVWNCVKLREDRQRLPLTLAVFLVFFIHKLSLLAIYGCLPLIFGLFAIFSQITSFMDGSE